MNKDKPKQKSKKRGKVYTRIQLGHDAAMLDLQETLPPAPETPAQGSRMASGKDLAIGVDHRIAILRYTREVMDEILSDLAGTEFGLSRIQKELAFSIAFMCGLSRDLVAKKAEDEERKMKGEDPLNVYDMIEHIALMRTIMSVSKQLGMKKIPRTVLEPESLEEYLKTHKKKRGRKSKRQTVRARESLVIDGD